MEAIFQDSSVFGLGSPLSPTFQAWQRKAGDEEEIIMKALTTGQDIVTEGDGSAGDGSKLRKQFLHNQLQIVAADPSVASNFAFMSWVDKKKVYSTTFEYTTLNDYGDVGDGFIGETNTTIDGSSVTADDIFARRLKKVAFMSVVKTVSDVTVEVNNLQDPRKTVDFTATATLIGLSNIAAYWGDSRKQTLQSDGIMAQVEDYLYPTTLGGIGKNVDDCILFDCGGLPLDREVLAELENVARQNFGNGWDLFVSMNTMTDIQKGVFGLSRAQLGEQNTQLGSNYSQYHSPLTMGNVTFRPDNSLLANRPLSFIGDSVTGKPRSADHSKATATVGTSVFGGSASGGNAYGVVVGNPGTADWFVTGALAGYDNPSAPALPTTPVRGIGQNSNRLAAGTYCYAVSVVYGGYESKPIFLQYNATAGSITGHATTPVGVPVTAGQIVRLNFTHAGITGTNAANVKFRIYRATGSAVTTLSSYALVGECGRSTALYSSFWDNGYQIPGTENAFMLTRNDPQNNNGTGVFYAQLLPIRKKALASGLMNESTVWGLFGTPVVLNPRKQIVIRNIGRY